MKKFLYMAVAAIAALSSCTSDDIVVNENENQNQNGNAPVFTATIEGEAQTRTQLVEGSTDNLKKVNWLSTDKVFIGAFNEQYAPVVLGEYSVTPGTPATTATLTPGSNLKYTAEGTPANTIGIYPSSISVVGALSNEEIASYVSSDPMAIAQEIGSLTLPATQTYNGSDISKIAPMMGLAQGSTELQFSNVTSLLAITVDSRQMNSVQTITVSSDKRLSGGFVARYFRPESYWGLLPASDPTVAEKSVTLNCQNEGANTAIPSGESKTFYVSIPDNTYGYLQIDVTDGTNTKTMKTKAESITVERNKIYPITFADNQPPISGTSDDDVDWVQLWENGPKFVTMDLTAKSSGYSFEEAKTNNENWGEFQYKNCIVPSSDDFQALIDNTDESYNDGDDYITFTGRGRYSANSITLKLGCYWSSTENGSYYGFLSVAVEEGNTNCTVDYTIHYYEPYNVRLILNESDE